ncbi:hypothetical protein HPT27_10970 [Permianibacter sp. IMCC34836]|uniref:CBU_0585 family protein n=1 Tax=Permianibacter fluminis TaxID=2738515 RepID=UPI001557C7D3|nr:CBU_0585 family protein [Permianibacter fluminis]NQD37548.1 hypothetical protein [Permianibacter fluminis]
MSKIDRAYVSDSTRFLQELEKKPENNQSPARKAEETKYQRINALRDEAKAAAEPSKIWSGF